MSSNNQITSAAKKLKVKKPKPLIEFIIEPLTMSEEMEILNREYPIYFDKWVEVISRCNRRIETSFHLSGECETVMQENYFNLLGKKRHQRHQRLLKISLRLRFDITRLNELPEMLVNYCVSFLSTPEDEDYFFRNAPRELQFYKANINPICREEDGPPIKINKRTYKGEHFTNPLGLWPGSDPRFYWKTFEEWRRRPSYWWKEMVMGEQERLWNEKYRPSLTEKFQKMSNSRLKQLTAGVDIITFKGKNDRSQTKKNWLETHMKMAPQDKITRKWCIWLILLSRGLKPQDGNLFHLKDYNPADRL